MKAWIVVFFDGGEWSLATYPNGTSPGVYIKRSDAEETLATFEANSNLYGVPDTIGYALAPIMLPTKVQP